MCDITEVQGGHCRMCLGEYDQHSPIEFHQRVPEKSNCWRHFYDEGIKVAVISSSNSLDVCPQCLSTCEKLEALDDRLEEVQMEIDKLIHQFTSNLLKSRKAMSNIFNQPVEHIKVEPTINFLQDESSMAYDYQEYDIEDVGDETEQLTRGNMENTEVKIVLERLNEVGPDGRMIDFEENDEEGNEYIIEECILDEDQIRVSDGQGHVCHVCGKVLVSQRSLDDHRKIHTGEKPFQCHLCEKTFRIRALLKRHLLCHTGERPFRCRSCGIAFATMYHFRRHTTSRTHLANYHKAANADVPIVSKRKRTILPIKIVTQKKPQQLVMRQRQLAKKIAEESLKRNHKKQGHHKCDVCGKVFNESNRLVEHFRIHTGEKPFVCAYCNKDFRLRSFLIIHERTHTGERPFPCHICGIGFIQKSGLNDHCKTQKHLEKIQKMQ